MSYKNTTTSPATDRRCRRQRRTVSRQPEQDQRDRGGGCLNQQNPAADGGGAVNTGNDHAEQKERLDLEGKGGNALNQPPDQSRRDRADPALAGVRPFS